MGISLQVTTWTDESLLLLLIDLISQETPLSRSGKTEHRIASWTRCV